MTQWGEQFSASPSEGEKLFGGSVEWSDIVSTTVNVLLSLLL